MPVPLAPYLTDELRVESREIGLARFRRAKELDRTQPYGDPGDEKRKYIDCYSALAEALVAKWLGVPWVKELRDDLSVKPPDVGTRTDVKWTEHTPGHLITHEEDEDDWIFVLTRKELPHIEVVGWTTGLAAKERGYLWNPKARNSEKDFWMPAKHLLMGELLYDIRHAV